MNDQPQMMNQPPPLSQQMMNQLPPPQIPVQLNQNPVILGQSAPVQPQSQMMTQQHPPLMMMNQRNNYKPWQQQLPIYPYTKPRTNKNWKGKNVNNKRIENPNPNNPNLSISAAGGGGSGSSSYIPPSLNDLQNQNRMKARKYYHPKKKFNNRFAPYAPRNTTSFIIRAKKAGGIASLVSPCPVTPAVLPTPIFSPSREVLGDMAKEEWGVDGYGSMKGLIRLRSPGNDADHEEEDDEEGNGSGESDVEEHVEVERRLDHDLSRFEMIYPSYGGGEYSYNNVLENRVDDQDTHIAQLEEENLTLKERLFLMERELGDLRRRMQFLERQQLGHGRRVMSAVEDINEEVVDNVSDNDENESDGGSDIGATRDQNNNNDKKNDSNNTNNNNEVMAEYIDGNVEARNVISNIVKERGDACAGENLHSHVKNHIEAVKDDEVKNNDVENQLVVQDEVLVKGVEVKVGKLENEVITEKLTVKEEELPKPGDFSDNVVQYQMDLEKDHS